MIIMLRFNTANQKLKNEKKHQEVNMQSELYLKKNNIKNGQNLENFHPTKKPIEMVESEEGPQTS